jgi:hypothetical protein
MGFSVLIDPNCTTCAVPVPNRVNDAIEASVRHPSGDSGCLTLLASRFANASHQRVGAGADRAGELALWQLRHALLGGTKRNSPFKNGVAYATRPKTAPRSRASCTTRGTKPARAQTDIPHPVVGKCWRIGVWWARERSYQVALSMYKQLDQIMCGLYMPTKAPTLAL